MLPLLELERGAEVAAAQVSKAPSPTLQASIRHILAKREVLLFCYQARPACKDAWNYTWDENYLDPGTSETQPSNFCKDMQKLDLSATKTVDDPQLATFGRNLEGNNGRAQA